VLLKPSGFKPASYPFHPWFLDRIDRLPVLTFLERVLKGDADHVNKVAAILDGGRLYGREQRITPGQKRALQYVADRV
jgi:hypothetical protein